MIISAILQGLSNYVGSILSLPPAVWSVVSGAASFVVIASLFAAIFKFLPDVKIAWKDVFVGAVFTAAFFTIGKFVMAWYLGREATASAYGATGALAIVLLWVYYSSIILLFGAEFTQVATVQGGGSILPDRDAVLIEESDDPPQSQAVAPSPSPAHAVESPSSAIVGLPSASVRASPGPLVWTAGTLVPAVAGWSLGRVIKAKALSMVGKSPLLRASAAGWDRLGSRHPKLLKLAVIGAVLAARRVKKSRAG
jgi:hypothetical protein